MWPDIWCWREWSNDHSYHRSYGDLHGRTYCDLYSSAYCDLHGRAYCDLHGRAYCDLHGRAYCDLHGSAHCGLHTAPDGNSYRDVDPNGGGNSGFGLLSPKFAVRYADTNSAASVHYACSTDRGYISL